VPDVKHFDSNAVLATAMKLFWRDGIATTGIQDIVVATGVNRSSLYATFGGKRELYLAALRRYVDLQSRPAFSRLADDPRGLPAISEFFAQLIKARCSGEYARWGCLMSNAQIAMDADDQDVREIINEHHGKLRDALGAALAAAVIRGQLRPEVSPDEAADMLALLAYAVNLRSRAGADPAALSAAVAATLALLNGQSSG
jgi:TetR/AcrR family transcriptional repressor of nem operon